MDGKGQDATEVSVIGKKRGAPILAEEEKRSERYFIHMTKAEKEAVVTWSRLNNMKLSEFFRAAAVDYMKRY